MKHKAWTPTQGNYYYYYYYYYYVTAIGLTPGGSSIHSHTNSTQNTEDGTRITITRKKFGSKFGSAGRDPSLRVQIGTSASHALSAVTWKGLGENWRELSYKIMTFVLRNENKSYTNAHAANAATNQLVRVSVTYVVAHRLHFEKYLPPRTYRMISRIFWLVFKEQLFKNYKWQSVSRDQTVDSI
jgi:hypothetical protein